MDQHQYDMIIYNMEIIQDQLRELTKVMQSVDSSINNLGEDNSKIQSENYISGCLFVKK